MTPEIRKGQLIVVKAPPYYEKTYFYEVISAGTREIRATLYHSPKVKKSWTAEQFKVSLEMGVIRLAGPDEKP